MDKVKCFEKGMLEISRNMGAGLRAIGNNLKSYWRRFKEWWRRWEDGLSEKCEGCPMENRDIIWCGIATYHPGVAKCYGDELKKRRKENHEQGKGEREFPEA